MNFVIMIGRLTRDPEMRTTTNGKNVVNFGLAVDRDINRENANGPTVDFFECYAWDNTAKFVNQYFIKGKPIAIQGRLRTRKYTNRNGQDVRVTEIEVLKAEFAGGVKVGGDQQGQSQLPGNAPVNVNEPGVINQADLDAVFTAEVGGNDDLPF